MPVFGDFSKLLKRSLRSRRGVCSRCVRAKSTAPSLFSQPPLPLPFSLPSQLLVSFDICLAASSGLLPESALLLLLLSFILFFSSLFAFIGRTPGKPAARFLYSDLRLKTFPQSR